VADTAKISMKDSPRVSGTPGAARPLEAMITRRRRRRWEVQIFRIALLILVIALWQELAGPQNSPHWHLIDTFYISRPSDIWDQLRSWYDAGTLLGNTWSTAMTTVIGLVIGIVSGLVVGFLLGINHMLSDILQPYLTALYSIPRLALIPLFLIWFGVGDGPKLVTVITIVFFMVFYNTHSGIRDVDPQLINMMKVMGAGRWRIYGSVMLPSAMVWIIAGMRVSVPYALVSAVTAEMMVGDQGLGYLVQLSASQFDTAGVFAAILIMMIIGMALAGIVNLFERRALRWKGEL
jgi:NitT/TauT family transport system permease protein